MSLSKDLVNIIKKTQETKTSPYDTQAEVVRVEGGTAWVHIPGGVDETPVRMTINARQGDTVQVRVANGTAFLVGNGSAPPTDDHKADIATNLAYKAQETAEEAVAGINGVVQYFWHDANGAHITEIPQKEFVENPSGSNLLARSDGVALRSGTTDLATFGSDEILLGHKFGATHAGVSITPSSLAFSPRYYESSFRYEIVSADTQVTQRIIGCGARLDTAILRWKAGTSLAVTIDGVTTTNYHTVFSNNNSRVGGLSFDTAPYPADGSVVEITYTVDSYDVYQLGVGSITAPYGLAEGLQCHAYGFTSHAEGNASTASGSYSHAQNYHTVASGSAQTAMGRWNVQDSVDAFALIIGNGKSNSTRSDALEVTWDGDILVADDTDISAALTELGW